MVVDGNINNLSDNLECLRLYDWAWRKIEIKTKNTIMTQEEFKSKVKNLTEEDMILQFAYNKSFKDTFGVEPNCSFVSMLSMGFDEPNEVIPLCFTIVSSLPKSEEQCVELANLLWTILTLDLTLKERCTLDEDARQMHAVALCRTSDRFLGDEVTRKALKIINLVL